MLRDAPIREIPGDLPRKWLMDDFLELVLWYGPEEKPIGFELIYDRMSRPRSVRWFPGRQARFYLVETGEDNPGKNRTPMLESDGPPDWDRIRREFDARSVELPAGIREWVAQVLKDLATHPTPRNEADRGTSHRPCSGQLRPSTGALLLALMLTAASAWAQGTVPWLETPPSEIQELPSSARVERKFLRIATWNIEWYPAGQRKGAAQQENWQTAAVAHLINQIKPDILATQEIRNLPALTRLNRNIGLWPFSHLASSIFYQQNDSAVNTDRIQQQCGLLACHPWEKIWEVDFTPMDPAVRPTRGWLAARWTIGPHRFTLYNGHLKSDFGAKDDAEYTANRSKRRAAITELKADLERNDLDPYRDKIIVLGDFNADYFLADPAEERVFADLADMGFRMATPPLKREEAITVPARKGVDDVPDLVLDYIWLSSGWREVQPELQILTEGASKEKNVFGGDAPGLASDHYPIYIDIPLKSPGN